MGVIGEEEYTEFEFCTYMNDTQSNIFVCLLDPLFLLLPLNSYPRERALLH